MALKTGQTSYLVHRHCTSCTRLPCVCEISFLLKTFLTVRSMLSTFQNFHFCVSRPSQNEQLRFETMRQRKCFSNAILFTWKRTPYSRYLRDCKPSGLCSASRYILRNTIRKEFREILKSCRTGCEYHTIICQTEIIFNHFFPEKYVILQIFPMLE